MTSTQILPMEDLWKPIRNVAYYRILLYLLRYKRYASISEIKRGYPAQGQEGQEDEIHPPPRKPDNHHKRYTSARALLFQNNIIESKQNPKYKGGRLIRLKPRYIDSLTPFFSLDLLDLIERNIDKWSKRKPEESLGYFIEQIARTPNALVWPDNNITRDTLRSLLKRESATIEQFRNSFEHIKSVIIPAHPKRILRERPTQKIDYLLSFFQSGRYKDEPRLSPLTECVMYHLWKTEGPYSDLIEYIKGVIEEIPPRKIKKIIRASLEELNNRRAAEELNLYLKRNPALKRSLEKLFREEKR